MQEKGKSLPIVEVIKNPGEKGVTVRREVDLNKPPESKVEMEQLIRMVISDVPQEDAYRFKQWCDKHVNGRQSLGIKVLMSYVNNFDIIINHILVDIDNIKESIKKLQERSESNGKSE